MTKAAASATTDELGAATTATAARLFGVSSPAVDRWRGEIAVADGVWRIEKTGVRGAVRWDLPKLVSWRIARMAAAVDAKQATKTLDPLETERLRTAKLQNDEREEMLVSREELEREWARAGNMLRQRLERIGRRHGSSVANDLIHALNDLRRDIHGLLGKT